VNGCRLSQVWSIREPAASSTPSRTGPSHAGQRWAAAVVQAATNTNTKPSTPWTAQTISRCPSPVATCCSTTSPLGLRPSSRPSPLTLSPLARSSSVRRHSVLARAPNQVSRVVTTAVKEAAGTGRSMPVAQVSLAIPQTTAGTTIA